MSIVSGKQGICGTCIAACETAGCSIANSVRIRGEAAGAEEEDIGAAARPPQQRSLDDAVICGAVVVEKSC